MKRIVLLVLLTVLALVLAPLQIAKADGSSPWSEILNPDGSVQWSKLVDLGTSSEKADWMDVPLPGGLVLKQEATYHRYKTPSGNILVLPSPATLFFMALHPNESGLSNAQSMLGNGASILFMLIGGSMTPDQLAKLVDKGYTDPAQFFQAVIEGRENIWSIINFNFLTELFKMSQDSGFLVNALLLYLNGAANCASIPGGCAGLPANCHDLSCLPKPSICPAPTIAQATATLTIAKIEPGHPLVVGQDPNKRGADIQASVILPPVIFTWFEPVQDPPTCQFDAAGNGHGCAGPGSKYNKVLDQNGSSISWSRSMENNSSWKVVDGEMRCVRHVETLPEAITSLQATAQLDAKSQAWIVNDLAGKYYEAFVHRPFFALVPEMAPAITGCDGSQVCSARALVPAVPFADPGTFVLKLTASTAGTVFHWNGVDIPITRPRILTVENSLQVYVTLVTLIPAGAP